MKKIEKQRNEILSKKQFLSKFLIEKNKTGIGITNLNNLTKYFKEMKPNECVKKITKEISVLFSEEILLDCTKLAQTKFEQINLQNREIDEGLIINKNETEYNFLKPAKSINDVEELIKEKIKLISFKN